MLPENRQGFVDKVLSELKNAKVHYNKRSIESLAKTFGIEHPNTVKELTELAIVKAARELALEEGVPLHKKYEHIVALYNNQVNLSQRTSRSISLQQYSTPAPIGFLASTYATAQGAFENGKGILFEPSAGNGLLTIAVPPSSCVVNEIDELRNKNLQTQGYKEIFQKDASKSFGEDFYKRFDAVVTNPPFGGLDLPEMFSDYPIKALEHAMAIHALNCMKDKGRAAIIIGGHTTWDERGRVQAGKNRVFISYLHHYYNVDDVININGQHLYSRQGTSFDVRLILINGRKEKPEGYPPLYNAALDKEVMSFDELFTRVKKYLPIENSMHNELELEAQALEIELELLKLNHKQGELGAPYIPASVACNSLQVSVPDSMEQETQSALLKIKNETGGDITDFVRRKLNYSSKEELCKALAAEQIDAVAMAIYNVEYKGQAMIIGDQTGIGKGRIAASMIRYGYMHYLKPVFITEKPNLFSDLYRDLMDTGSGYLVPFIINGRESKTHIKDSEGNILHQALHESAQKEVFKSGKIPEGYDFVLATYSQFNAPKIKPDKPNFLLKVAENNLLIMDESHNASGDSNTGAFLQDVISTALGVTFLSATFAKTPANMPVYAIKTCISEANMTRDELISAIEAGGVALQEIISSQLVKEGQMLRRERTYEGVPVRYLTLSSHEEKHRATADKITEIIREIIAFQESFVDKIVDEMDAVKAAEYKNVEKRKGTSGAGVSNSPYFSKVFNVISQMLLSIKADAVADLAIDRLKEGFKPVIAFANTMGSFLEDMVFSDGRDADEGMTINTDFSIVLQKGLDGVMRYTEKDEKGNPTYKHFGLAELSPEAKKAYLSITEKIEQVSTGITISPIDYIVQKIEAAGFKCAEVTGRKLMVQLNKESGTGVVLGRKKLNTNDAFRTFNDNETDVLLINQAGSTGASAHAVVRPKVPLDKVKPRVMIVLQPELDINKEVQKRGRIFRSGQVLLPAYDYVSSAIPAEKRLMMMLQRKLKSLDANTSSNQKNSSSILNVDDFLNKYGDKVVVEYLQEEENAELNELIGDPLGLQKSGADSKEKGSEENLTDAANRVAGRVAILSTSMQQKFYEDILDRYKDYITYLDSINEYDLEVQTLNLEAETKSQQVIIKGKGGDSAFSEDSILETAQANVLRKPMPRSELDKLINEELKGRDAEELQKELLSYYESFSDQKLEEEMQAIEKKYDKLVQDIPNEKKIAAIINPAEREAAITERTEALENAREGQRALTQREFENKSQYIKSLFRLFEVGRPIAYPSLSYEQGTQITPAVFTGFTIDRKKNNPFAPSAIKLKIAIADSNRFIAIPASYVKDVNGIIGASARLSESEKEKISSNWDELIKAFTAARKTRYIITGNILQAYTGDRKGKLVSFTTLKGDDRKGILLPDNWQPGSDNGSTNLTLPIAKARIVIKNLAPGQSIYTGEGIEIAREHDLYYEVITGASQQRFGHIFLDTDLLDLVRNKEFIKVSDRMKATLEKPNMDKFITLLQQKFNDNTSISAAVYDQYRKEIDAEPVSLAKQKKVELNKRPMEEKVSENLPPSDPNWGEDLELEALALEVELQLLQLSHSHTSEKIAA